MSKGLSSCVKNGTFQKVAHKVRALLYIVLGLFHPYHSGLNHWYAFCCGQILANFIHILISGLPNWHRGVRKRDDVIKWKHFSRYWLFVREIHRSPVNSPHKGQRRGVLVFSLISAWINTWVINREAGDLRRHLAHYDVTVMDCPSAIEASWTWIQ